MIRKIIFLKIFSFFLFILLINYQITVNCVIAREKTKTCKDVNCTGVFFSTTVTRDFVSNHPSFQSLKIGDKIDVVAIKFSHRGDIMEGVVNGERGYFYTNFIDKDPYHRFLLNVTEKNENTLSIVSFSEDKTGKGLFIKNVVAADFLDSDVHIALNPNGVYIPKKNKEDDSGHGHSHGGHGHSHGGYEETSHNHKHNHEEGITTTTMTPSIETKPNGNVPSLDATKNDFTATTTAQKIEDSKPILQNNIEVTSPVSSQANVPEKDLNNNIINSDTTLEHVKTNTEVPDLNKNLNKIDKVHGSSIGELDDKKLDVKQEVSSSIPSDSASQISNTEVTTPAPMTAGINPSVKINSEATVSPPIAGTATLAPTIAALTTPTPTPTIAAVTTPASTIAAITTPAPTIAEVATPAPTIAAVTTPASTIAAITTPAPTISEVTTPIVEKITTQSSVVDENSILFEEITTPLPIFEEITTSASVVVDKTTVAPIVNEQKTTPNPIESISLPPLNDLLVPSSIKNDLSNKLEEEAIQTTTPSPIKLDSFVNEANETKEKVLQEDNVYNNHKSEEIDKEKSFMQLYIGYYLKMIVASFRETLPDSFSKIDDSGIILLILAPMSILIHLTNKFLFSDDESQEIFERKYLHDSLTKIKEQEVMIKKLKETQADPQLISQFHGLKEEYERIYKENQELLKAKELLIYENGNFKKMFERKENENHNLKEELKITKEKLFIKDDSVVSLEKKIIQLQSDSNSLLQENEQLKESMEEKDKKIDNYSKECEANVEENKILKLQIIDIEEQLKNGKEEHDKLRKEIEGLSELLEEMNQNSQNQDNEGAGSIGSTGWSDVGDVEIESAGSNSLGCNKNGKRRSPDLGGGNILDLARSRAEIKRLEQEIEDITVKLNKETVTKDGLLNKISMLEHEIDAQKNELTHNATERNENSAQISRLLTLVEERSNEIKDLQSREKELRTEYMELDQKYRDLRDEKLGIEFKCKESESLVKSLQSEVNKLETINYNEVRKLKNQLKLLEEEKNSEIKGLKFQNETLQSRVQLSNSEVVSGSGIRQPMGLSEGLPITASNPLMNSSGPIRPLWSDVDDAPVASSNMRNQASLFGSELDSSDNGSLKKNVKIRKSMKKSKPPLHEGMLNTSYNGYVMPSPHLEYASSSGRRSVGREMLAGGSQTSHNTGNRRTRSRSQGRESERLVSPLTFTGYDFPEYQQHSYHHLQPSNQRQK
uniref:SH3 domain-containing protein n=1 Tax=Strongyloides stercoralis TaxID=6248 RepID=A0A0K0E6X7_STRER